MLAEAFLNFGILGVVGLMSLFGIVNDRLSMRVRGQPSDLYRVFYVLYVLSFLTFVQKSGLTAAVTFFDIKVALLLVTFVVTRPRQVVEVSLSQASPSAQIHGMVR